MRPNLHFPADLVTFAEEILNVFSRNRLKETLYLFYSNEQTNHPYLGSIDVHLFEKLFFLFYLHRLCFQVNADTARFLLLGAKSYGEMAFKFVCVPSQLNSLSANPLKWPNTLKQFVGC